MDSLRDKASAKMVKKALEILPKGLDALNLAYDGAMQRVENQREGFRVLAKQLLGWLTYSERLMTVKELQHALAIEPETPDLDEDNLSDIDEVVGFCAGLVIVDERTQIIRLVHYTTQEYFRRNGNTLLASAQQDIAISCLTYLLYDNFGAGWVIEAGSEEFDGIVLVYSLSVKPRLQKYPFLNYAARYWANHARVVGQQNVKELMVTFAKEGHRVSNAAQVLLISNSRDEFSRSTLTVLDSLQTTRSHNPLSAIHLLAYLGYENLILELLNRGFDADAKDSCQNTPLWWAAWQGHHAVVELLLSQGHVNVNNRGVQRYKYNLRFHQSATPLGEAAYWGKDDVVRILIEREDVDMNLPDGGGSSPLYYAANQGHYTIVELLLTRSDIEVNSRNSDGRTSLSIAAQLGREDVVRQLLKRKDIQVNTVDKWGYSPLAEATHTDHEGIFKMLLGHAEIDVNTIDNSGNSPLMIAVRRNEAMVKLLLSHANVEANCENEYGETVLHCATQVGSASMMQLSISRTKVDVNMKNKDGDTPLHVAAEWESEASVRALLEYVGIEVNAKNNRGVTPLAQAIIARSTGVIKLLCAHPDVDLNPTDNEGQDVFALVMQAQEYVFKNCESMNSCVHEFEECLEILRTAIAKRSEARSLSSQPEAS